MAAADDGPGAPTGLDGAGLRVGVLRARWNAEIVERLHAGARAALARVGVADADVVEQSVPGSFEVPLAALVMARRGDVDAIVCLGCVMRGETTHYELVSEGVASGLMRVQLETGVPIGFGVLAVEDHEQALARSQAAGRHNVGEGAALAAVEMARLVGRRDRH